MAQNISYKSTFRGAVFFFPLSNIPRICSNCALVMSLGYFFVPYTHIPHILQTISSIITGLFGSFTAHSASVMASSYLFWFLMEVFLSCKKCISAQEICRNRFMQNRNSLSLKINYTYPHKKAKRSSYEKKIFF